MIKQIAWNTFKNTGDINTFLEFKNIEDISEANSLKDTEGLLLKKDKEKASLIVENIEANENENYKNKWSNNSRENHSRL